MSAFRGVIRDRLLILYGSETGNAEEVSYSLKDSLCNEYKTDIFSIDEYDYLNLPEEGHVLFVVSTTGDGDLPLSMKSFWSFLMRKSHSSTSLSTMKYAVFGLGDSSYDKFNFVARKLQARLKQLGGTEFLSVGLGDDQAKYSYFTSLNSWTIQLRLYLSSQSSLLTSIQQDTGSSLNTTTSNEIYSMTTHNADQAVDSAPTMTTSSLYEPVSRSSSSSSADAVLECKVVKNVRMTEATWSQDVRHLSLSMSTASDAVSSESANKALTPLYQPGDIAEVFYCNSTDLTQRALSLLITHNPHNKHLLADTVVSVRRNTEVFGVRRSRVTDVTCSVRDLFHRVLDIGAIPKRSFFSAMAPHATDRDEREKLLELSRAEGTDLYFDYCIKEKRNYLEVLAEFPSVQPPLSALLGSIPLIQPRQYSIASSAAAVPGRVELCVAVVDYRTPYKRHRLGLCSSYIASLSEGDSVFLRLKRGTVHDSAVGKMLSVLGGAESINTDSAQSGVSMILIGPGTGIAPMRSIVQQYLHVQSAAHGETSESVATLPTEATLSVDSSPRVLVFFGCRRREKDCLYGAEWDDINSSSSGSDGDGSGRGVRVEVAFSQDQRQKDYVTHSIRRNAVTVWKMIDEGCTIFVSGSAKQMPADVKKALVAAIAEGGGHSAQQSEDIMAFLVRSKRYVVEAWN